jgi:6-phosphogluconolactonase
MMEFIVNSEIIIKESIDELSHYIGELIIEELSSKPKLNIALSGGSTPKALFNYLSKNFALKIEWNKIHFFWGDERCVPPDDEQSNYKLANDFLFTRVNLPRENIYRIFGENDAEYEAERYSNIINEKVDSIFNLPSFDIVILGLGEDGHTASIFPHQMEILNFDNNCTVVQHPISNQKRITLTGRVINNSKKILFLVSGESKQKVVSEILNQSGNYSEYPASYINPKNGTLTWLLDKQAAALLDKLDSTQN